MGCKTIVDHDEHGLIGLEDQYEIKEVIGSGCFGKVHRCLSKNDSKEYAAKIVDLNHVKSEIDVQDTVDCYKKGAESLSLCSTHSHICQLKETFFQKSRICLILEICDGGDFFDYLSKVGPLKEFQAQVVLRQLLSAINFLHQQGIIHRDVKPQNLLLKNRNNSKDSKCFDIRLSDFGFSVKWSPGDPLLRDARGTPSFMAPEMLTAEMDDDAPGYSREVDLWAVGATLYYLLSGVSPFWHRRQLTMIRNITSGRLDFGALDRSRVSLEARNVIKNLLTVEPNNRITAKQALTHPFLLEAKEPSVTHNDNDSPAT